jgi:hypothetical protein
MNDNVEINIIDDCLNEEYYKSKELLHHNPGELQASRLASSWTYKIWSMPKLHAESCRN